MSRPRLRPRLRFIRRVEEGRPAWVVKDPVARRYYRFGEPEVALMRLMDGDRTPDQIAAALHAGTGIAATPAAVAGFARRLKEMGLVERSHEEKRLAMMERLRQDRKLRLQGHGNTLLRMRFALGDPDRLFDRVIPGLRFFFTPAFVAVSAALFATYMLIVATHWTPFVEGLGLLYDPSRFTLGFLVTLYGTALVIFAVHELGHGLTCKHFGGEVHEIGAMLFYFSPAFFCNVNDAWTLERRSHRLWVTFAGGWIQLVIGALAAITWVLVEPGTRVHDIAFAGVILGGGLILLLNFNPLIPLDGYYALMDWLEIPNLRPRSFAYVGALFKRGVLRLDTVVPTVTPRERRALLVYGVLALVYTAFVLALFLVWIGGMLVGWIGAWGWLGVAALVHLLLGEPLRRGWAVLRAWRAHRRGRVAWKGAAMAAGAVVALLAVLGLLPWTTRAAGTATVEPLDRAWLRPAEAGRVDRVDAAEGAVVAAGAPVLRLRSRALELERAGALAAVAALEREVASARSAGRTGAQRVAELELAARRDEAAALRRRIESLVLRAPFDARIATPDLHRLRGLHVQPGDSLVELWSRGPLRARVTLPLREAGGLRAGMAVGLRFPSRPGVTWRTRVAMISPAAREGSVDVLAPLPDGGEPALRAGMVGRAKITLARTSAAAALARALRRTIRLDWWL